MRTDRPLIVLIVVSTLALAGCAGPAEDPAAGDLEEAASMTLEPGSNASTLLAFQANATTPEEASLAVEDDAGLDVEVPDPLHGNENGTLSGWLSVSAPEDASQGEHAVHLSLSSGDGTSLERVVTVNVSSPETPLEEGEIAMLRYSALTADGQLALTNDPAVAQAPLPTVEGYQQPQSLEPLAAPLTPQGQLPAELVEAVIGSGVNHSLSVEIPGVFGPESVENTQPREETLEREVQVPSGMELPSQQAQRFVPPDAEEGDEVPLPVVQNRSAIPYTLAQVGEQQISFELSLDEGDTMTLDRAWPDSANVTEVGQEQATLYVTPTHEEGQMLTWVDPWGETTELVEITNETITLRHNPEEGSTYTQQDARSQQPVETTVVEVTEDEIVVSQENPHPLAGETLVFETTVVDRQQAPQPGPQPGQPTQPSPR